MRGFIHQMVPASPPQPTSPTTSAGSSSEVPIVTDDPSPNHLLVNAGLFGKRTHKSDANWFQSINYGEFAVVTGGYQFLYSDPMSPDSTQVSIDGGELVGVMTDTFIQTPKGRFYYIGQSPKGRGWMLEGSFQMAEVTELWRLGCLPCTGNSSPISPC